MEIALCVYVMVRLQISCTVHDIMRPASDHLTYGSFSMLDLSRDIAVAINNFG